jgi:hypothetical protein
VARLIRPRSAPGQRAHPDPSITQLCPNRERRRSGARPRFASGVGAGVDRSIALVWPAGEQVGSVGLRPQPSRVASGRTQPMFSFSPVQGRSYVWASPACPPFRGASGDVHSTCPFGPLRGVASRVGRLLPGVIDILVCVSHGQSGLNRSATCRYAYKANGWCAWCDRDRAAHAGVGGDGPTLRPRARQPSWRAFGHARSTSPYGAHLPRPALEWSITHLCSVVAGEGGQLKRCLSFVAWGCHKGKTSFVSGLELPRHGEREGAV